MFESYELAVTFGISAALTFSVSVVVLLSWAARRGLLRTGGTPRSDALLQPVREKPAPLDREMVPLQQ